MILFSQVNKYCYSISVLLIAQFLDSSAKSSHIIGSFLRLPSSNNGIRNLFISLIEEIRFVLTPRKVVEFLHIASTKPVSISDHEYQFRNFAANMSVPLYLRCDIVNTFHTNHTI